MAFRFGRPLWRVGLAALRGAGLDDAFAPLQQLQVARNDREQIIEVVSDITGRHLALGVLARSTPSLR
jgi:hypothetical protein